MSTHAAYLLLVVSLAVEVVPDVAVVPDFEVVLVVEIVLEVGLEVEELCTSPPPMVVSDEEAVVESVLSSGELSDVDGRVTSPVPNPPPPCVVGFDE